MTFLAAFALALWIEPSTFHPRAGETVSVSVRSHDEPERFFVRQGRDEEDIDGTFRAEGRPAAIVAYVSRPSRLDTPAAAFDSFLREHGLERIVAKRIARRESAKPARELVVHCAKAILAGAQTSIATTQPLGLRYEIVPNADPYGGGSTFRGRLVFDRKLLPRALVVAVFRDQPSLRLTARSDAQGNFAFALPRAGVWVIESVCMIEAPPESGAEWESFRASLTFRW